MLKPSGLLTYTVAQLGPIAGAGGSVGVNLISSFDAKGDALSVAKLPRLTAAEFQNLLVAVFVPETFGTAAADGGRCRVVKAATVVGGVLTAFNVDVFNDSPAGGDTVAGTLYCQFQHRENLGL